MDVSPLYFNFAPHDVGLPPPLDRTRFPNVRFGPGGYPLLGSPDEPLHPRSTSVIYQVVPSPSNPFALHFGEGEYRDWDSPEAVARTVEDAYDLGFSIVFHRRNPHIRVAGVSRGKARFLVGGGVTFFAAREVGLLPHDRSVFGLYHHEMVVVYGAVFPCPDGITDSYHVFPKEFLMDPAFPGLPPGLAPSEVTRWLAPPPRFYPGRPVAGHPGTYFARIFHGVSEKEAMEEDGGTYFQYTRRGLSYLIMLGL